jgi:hypothetical protein
LIGRTYSIIKSSRKAQKTVETVVETGLDWDTADSKRNKLDEIEREKEPLKRSWTRDLHLVRMEVVAK